MKYDRGKQYEAGICNKVKTQGLRFHLDLCVFVVLSLSGNSLVYSLLQ